MSKKKTADSGSKKKAVIIAITAAAVLLAIAGFLAWYFTQVYYTDKRTDAPTVKFDIEDSVSMAKGEIEVPVTLSDMPSGTLFPSATISATFDNGKLELTEIKPGTVKVLSDTDGERLAVPEWKLNIDNANDSGRINVLYLDPASGKCAFTSEGFDADSGNILFTLVFKIKTNAKSGDTLEFSFDDAVFAASDDRLSLAVTQNTLRTENVKITIAD